MAEQTAVYRAIAQFGSLVSDARKARRELERLRAVESDSARTTVENQREISDALEETVESRDLTTESTERNTEANDDNAVSVEGVIEQMQGLTRVQRDRVRAELDLERAESRRAAAETHALSLSQDMAASDEDQADALRSLRVETLRAADARARLNHVTDIQTRTGGLGGGPPGRGVATDVGSFFRQIQNAAAGVLGFLTLIAPTINTIIAGVVGLIGLLTSATVVLAKFILTAGRLAAVGALMAFVAFRFRDLLATGAEGVSEWRASILAIEAEAFRATQNLIGRFQETGEAGTSMWDKITTAGVKFVRESQPILNKWVDWFIEKLDPFIHPQVGVESPFTAFVKTWTDEWERLGKIVNQDLLPGGVGFFEKYEAPAKAFVEGIAQVINGIRKMSRAGLGLNMDQLTETIRNVFTALSEVVQYFPKFSNALVGVGQQFSEFLVDMTPIISAAFDVGSAILSGIVEPLAKLALIFTDSILNLPIIDWLTKLAAGWAIASFGLAKLSFGLLKFRDIFSLKWLGSISNAFKVFRTELALSGSRMEALGAVAPGLARKLTSLWGAVQALGRALAGIAGAKIGSNLLAGLIGGGAVLGVIAAGYLAIRAGSEGLADAQEHLRKINDDLWKSFDQGLLTLEQVKKQTHAAALRSYDDLNFWEKGLLRAKMVIQQPSRLVGIFGDQFREYFADQQTEDAINDRIQLLRDYASNAIAAIRDAGSLTSEQVAHLELVRAPEGGSLAEYNRFLGVLNEEYEKGRITTLQYTKVLDQLGIKFDETGEKIRIQALKVEGAAETISQAVLATQKTSEYATRGVEQFAQAAGEDVVGFRDDFVEAFTDIEGGIAGTGEKVNEWFQEQASFIEQWKNETADAFNFVTNAFQGLASEAKLSFDKVRDTLQGALDDQLEYRDNLKQLRELGASDELIAQVKEMGIAGAATVAALVQGGTTGVEQINRIVDQGGKVADTIANSFAKALGVTLDKLTSAVELFTAKFLGIPVNKVRKKVQDMVDGVNRDTEKVKDVDVKVNLTTPGERQLANVERRNAPGGAGKLDLGKSVAGAASSVTTSILNALSKVEAPVQHAFDRLAKTVREGSRNVGQAVVAGFRSGFDRGSGLDNIVTGIRVMGHNLISEFEDVLGIASPSKVFHDIGVAIIEGLREGLVDEARPMLEELKRLWNDVIEVFESAKKVAEDLGDSIRNKLIPSLKDLIGVLKNVPDVSIALSMDTTKAREAMEKFIDSLESKGLMLTGSTTTPGSSTSRQQRHTGGPAGTSPTYASGPPKSDEVDTRLRLGEYVLSVPSVEGLGGVGVVHQMAENAKRRRRLFHSGGAVENGSTGRSARRRRKYDTNEPPTKRLLHDGGSIEEIDETTTKRLFHSGGTVEEFDAPDLEYVAKSLMSMRNMEATVELPKQEFAQPLVAGGDVGGLTGLTAAAARFASNVRALFGNIGMGGKTIRPIAGTSTWSQHSYGNAIDVMAGYPGELHRAIAFWADANRRALAIHWLGADPWFPSPLRDHFNHVHADFYPQYTGDPYTDGHPYHSGGYVKSRRGYVKQGEYVFDRPAVEDIGVPTLQRLHEGGVPLDTTDTGDQPIDPRIPAVITRIPRVVKEIMKGVATAITAVTTEREARGWQRAMTREILAPGFGDQQHTLIRNAFEAVLDYNGREVATEVRVALRQFANNREMPRPIEFPVKEDKKADAPTDDNGVPQGEPPRVLFGRTAAAISEAKKYGQAMVTKKWSANEYNPLLQLWTRESGWRWWAENPSSGAYGIPQSLPGTKMAAAGNDWRTNPLTQMAWGLGYIRARYGSPHAALAHSNATGWYKTGGRVKERRGVTHQDEFVLSARAARTLGYRELERANQNPGAFADIFRSGFGATAVAPTIPTVSTEDDGAVGNSRVVLNLHIGSQVIARDVALTARENEIRLPSR